MKKSTTMKVIRIVIFGCVTYYLAHLLSFWQVVSVIDAILVIDLLSALIEIERLHDRRKHIESLNQLLTERWSILNEREALLNRTRTYLTDVMRALLARENKA